MSDEDRQPHQADQLAKLKLKRRGQRAQMTKLFNRAEHLKTTFATAANKIEAHRMLTALNAQLVQKYQFLSKIEEDGHCRRDATGREQRKQADGN